MAYEIVTNKSAEQGDAADRGFTDSSGNLHSIIDLTGQPKALSQARPKPEEFDSLEEVIEFLNDYGPLEPSCSVLCQDGHCWLNQVNGSDDGDEEIRISFHFVDCDPSVQKKIIEAVIF